VIELRVYGEPQPQGNKTGFARGGRVVMVEGRRPESRAAFKDWRGAVAQAARDWQQAQPQPLVDGPVTVELTFWLTKPSSLPKWRWLPHGRPDIDKLARAVLDGITGTLITNDSRVVELVARKIYSRGVPPGCRIRVSVVDERSIEAVDDLTAVAS
jgi:crossover junction endodeoxyribonuclease RusA